MERVRGKESKRELQILNEVGQQPSKKSHAVLQKDTVKPFKVPKFDAPPTYFKLIDKNYRERFFNMTHTESKLFHSLVSSSVVPVLSKHVKPEYLHPVDFKSGRSVSSPSLLVPQIVHEAMERNMTNADMKVAAPKARENSMDKKNFLVQSVRKHHFMFKSSLARGFLPAGSKQSIMSQSGNMQAGHTHSEHNMDRSMNFTQRSVGFLSKGTAGQEMQAIRPVIKRLGFGMPGRLEFEPSAEGTDLQTQMDQAAHLSKNEPSIRHTIPYRSQHSVPAIESPTRSLGWPRKGFSHGLITAVPPQESQSPSQVHRGDGGIVRSQTDQKGLIDSPRRRLNKKFREGNFSLRKKASKPMVQSSLPHQQSAEGLLSNQNRALQSNTAYPKPSPFTVSPEELELNNILNS